MELPRRQEREDLQRGTHQWTKFELNTMFALICHGDHLEKPGRKSDGASSAYLDFATKLNNALHGHDYSQDINKREITLKLDDMMDERGHIIGKGGLVERWKGNGKPTAALRKAWDRGPIFGQGDMARYRAIQAEGRARVPERPQLHEHYSPIRQIDRQIQRNQKRQPISAERIEQPPFRLIDPRRKEVPMPLPLPEFDARTVSQPAIPSFSTQSSYPTTSALASASTGEPRKQKRPGLAKYSRMARIPKQSDFEPAAAAAPSYPPSTQYHPTSHYGAQDQYAAALTPQYQPSHDQFAPTPQHQSNNDFYAATPQYQPDSATQYGDDDRYAAMPLYQEDSHYAQTPQYQTSSMDQYGDNDRYAQTPLYQEEDPRYAQTPQYRDNSRHAETPRYEPGPMPRYGSRPAPAPASAFDEDEMFAAFDLPEAPTAPRFAASSSTAAATGSNSYPLASRITSGGEHGGFASVGGWGGDGEYAVGNMGYREWEDTGYMGEDRNGFEGEEMEMEMQ